MTAIHLDDERLQRLLHGELDAVAAAAARAHLAGCTACSARLGEAEREERAVFDLLDQLDRTAPAVSVAHVIARGASGARWARWGRRAAVIALALAVAGTAYALPGSPLRAWVDRLVGRAPQHSPVGGGPAGVAVTPGARFTIVFTAPQDRGVVTVSLVDGGEVVARRLGGSASFTSDEDRLTISNVGAQADYEVDLPRGAPWIEVRVAERQLLVKDGDRTTTDVPRDAQGRWVVALRR